VCDKKHEDYIADLEHENRELLYRITKLEQARNYYPGFPAPGPRQREIVE
jgi:hypothetical protein